jgi:hypothetical protein
MGTRLASFQLGGVTTRRRLQLSLLAAIALPLIVSMVMLGSSQLTDTINTGPEGGRERITSFFVTLFVLGLPIFVIVQLPRWWKRVLQVEIYENGLSSNGQFWSWSDFDRLVVYPDTMGVMLYNGDTLIFEVNGDKDSLAYLCDTLEQETSAAWLPRLIDAYQKGDTLRFGNLTLSREAVQQNDVRLPLAVLYDFVAEVKENRIALRRRNGVAVLVIILRGLPNGHLLSPLLENLFPDGRVKREATA